MLWVGWELAVGGLGVEAIWCGQAPDEAGLDRETGKERKIGPCDPRSFQMRCPHVTFFSSFIKK